MDVVDPAPSTLAVESQVPLAPRTTFQIGGPAAWWAEPASEDAVREALHWAAHHRCDVAVLGGGSNVLIHDAGFDGLVLGVAVRGIEQVSQADGRVRVRVGAGELLDHFIERCVQCAWSGLECLSGIPGTVGATPVQNVGAYGQEVASAIVEVHAMDRRTLAGVRMDRAACGFSYRSSAFKHALRDRYVLTAVVFELALGQHAQPPRYQELARRLAELGISNPTLTDLRREILSLRRAKSMLVDPVDPNHRSAGSFFTNPVVPHATADALERCLSSVHGVGPMPRHASDAGVKLSAAWLMERAGFVRGTVAGNVGLSTRHALALVNRGGASAVEILEFASKIRHGVHERMGVSLEPEPVLLGFSAESLRRWFPPL